MKYENKIIGCVHGHTHFDQGIGKVHKIKIYKFVDLLFKSFGAPYDFVYFIHYIYKNKQKNVTKIL